ncbi:MAG: glutamyl-tRNA reductase [Gammaproteobacteria bacterium]|nr:glutamyl-tRNA reductase [Gammaproteobacteria bacterium]
MPVITLGLNHKTAPVELRETVAFDPAELARALADLRASGIAEAGILSTCNRMEVFAVAEDGQLPILEAWLHRWHGLAPDVLAPYLYRHRGEEAVRHMMRVASGLDSLILGEPQILGQMKQAYADAQAAGMLGAHLDRLFQQVFAVAKQVRTDTAIGGSAVSVAFAAVSLAKRIFADLSRLHVLYVGAGETIELAARHFHGQGVRELTVANRTLSRAQDLTEVFGGTAIVLEQIPEHLAKADIVVASTASPLPILGKGLVQRVLKARRRRPMFMVDLAVPRDIEAEVGELDDVYLYTVDDLKDVVEVGLKERENAALEAEDIIAGRAEDYMRWLKSLDAVGLLRAFREKHEAMAADELARAADLIKGGAEPLAVLEQFASRLTNKFLHQPSNQIRAAGAEGEGEVLSALDRLFALSNRP